MDIQNEPRLSIHDAAEQGNYAIVEAWLKQDPTLVDSHDDFQNTPLIHAAAEGHLPIVKLLLAHGADPCAENEIKYTPLHIVVLQVKTTEQHHQIVELLLQQGINVQQLMHSNIRGSLLYEAAKAGHAEIVRLFLMHGTDPNAVNDKGYIAWHVGYDQYNPDIIATFLKHPNIKPDIRSANDDEPVIQSIVFHLKRTNLGKKRYKKATLPIYQDQYEEHKRAHAQLIQYLNYFIFAGVTLNEEAIKQACNAEFIEFASEGFPPQRKVLINKALRIKHTVGAKLSKLPSFITKHFKHLLLRKAYHTELIEFASVDFYLQITDLINEALRIKHTVETKLSRLPSFITKHSKHLLLSPESERNTFLQEVETLYNDRAKERSSRFFGLPVEIIDQIAQCRLNDLIGDYTFPDLNHNQAECDSKVNCVM